MSIGSWSARLKLSANERVSSVYRSNVLQEKHVTVRSWVVSLTLLLMLPFMSVMSVASPASGKTGAIGGWRDAVDPAQYYDWKYAYKVWAEMNTRSKLLEVFAPLDKDFDPWLELYKKNPRAALAEVEQYPKKKRINIKHGHDAQLAYDEWWRHIYMHWYWGYMNAYEKGQAEPFEQYIARFADSKSACSTPRALPYCGPFPDWRSERNKKDEAAHIAQVKACVACNRKFDGPFDKKRVPTCRPVCKGLGNGW